MYNKLTIYRDIKIKNTVINEQNKMVIKKSKFNGISAIKPEPTNIKNSMAGIIPTCFILRAVRASFPSMHRSVLHFLHSLPVGRKPFL